MSIDQSSLRTLYASGQTLASLICSFSHRTLSNYIEILHLLYYNRPIHIHLSALHCINLLDIVYCLNYCSSFPTTIHLISVLLFCFFSPNYVLPNWSVVLHSLSIVPQLSALRIFMHAY